MSKTKKQIENENKYLNEQLTITRNAFYFARQKIDELNNILENVDEKMRELEDAIAENNRFHKHVIKNEGVIEDNKMKTINEPKPKKKTLSKRKHPEHEMYKHVVPLNCKNRNGYYDLI